MGDFPVNTQAPTSERAATGISWHAVILSMVFAAGMGYVASDVGAFAMIAVLGIFVNWKQRDLRTAARDIVLISCLILVTDLYLHRH